MLSLLLAACGTTHIETTAPACEAGFERGDDGVCAPIADTEVIDADTDTDTDSDTDADSGTDTAPAVDTGPFDTDGDGVVDADDCDPADPAVFPGAADDTDDDRDNDCDGQVDEDFDPCSIVYGTASLSSAVFETSTAGTVDFGFAGPALVCGWTCTDSWVHADGLCMDASCGAYWTFPYASGADVLPLVATVSDPGAGPGASTTCTLTTSAGVVTARVVWAGGH
jgi:hypothetical protein